MSFNLQRSLTSNVNKQYWGAPSSSVDWCEMNYEVTTFIAEYFNTISSFAMAVVGMLGVVLHPWAEMRFHMAFQTTVAVGLGSVAFHCTLGKFSQALDEVPMLYSALAFTYIGICERYSPSARVRRFLAIGLTFHAIFTTLLVTMSEGFWQFFLFHVSFGTAQLFAIVQVICIYRDREIPHQFKSGIIQRSEITESSKHRKHTHDRKISLENAILSETKQLLNTHHDCADSISDHSVYDNQRACANDPVVLTFQRGILSYGVATFCWLTDMLFCELVNPHYKGAILPFNPQLHAWWHIFVSIGLYHLALLTLAARVDSKYGAGRAVLRFWFNIIPYIKIVPKLPDTAFAARPSVKVADELD
ncbi:hypothetical protein BDV3_000239 [Batrachochytrium dendrobatidis]